MPSHEYADDPFVEDDEEIWRRIPLDQVHPGSNGWRPQSGTFSDSSQTSPMSAHRARCYRDPRDANREGFVMVGVTAGFLRSLNLKIATYPPVEDDPGHLWIAGKKSTSFKRRLARNAKWVIPPEGESQQFFDELQVSSPS